MLFEGKVSIVTGASQGIGEAIAEELAREGAHVALVDVQQEKLEALAARFRAAGWKASARVAGVTRLDGVVAVVEDILRDLGRIDHLVNNAGITRDNLLLRMKEEEWDAVIGVNLKGSWNFAKAVIRPMIAAEAGSSISHPSSGWAGIPASPTTPPPRRA
jgi:3-oxoacyl-[acyl-carrier protein] reductase